MTATASAAETCDYCGQPVPRALFSRRQEEQREEPRFCCTGCRIAAAITQEAGEAGSISWTLTSLGLSIFFTMSVMVFTIAHWMYGAYDPEATGSAALARTFGQLLQWLALLFSAPVLILLGRPLAEEVVSGLGQRTLSSDLLLLTGVIAAFVYSAVNVVRGAGPIYLEVGCVILVAVTSGRWLGATARHRANSALDELQRLLPELVHRLRNGVVEEVTLDAVTIDDVIIIRAGERIPVDGNLVEGIASIDEQVFTGESAPVRKAPGESAFAGTLNLDGSISLQVTARPREGAFGTLLEAVNIARQSKGFYQAIADRVSSAFFPIVTVIALGTSLFHGLRQGWDVGLMSGLAVILIACPCALALATPLAVWAGISRATRAGILFRNGSALERLASVTCVQFDKTGTITTGTPRIAAMRFMEGASQADVLRRVAAMTAESNHVYSRALHKAVESWAESDHWLRVETIAGEGLVARWPGDIIPTRIGNRRWLEDADYAIDAELLAFILLSEERGQSVVVIGWNRRVKCAFALDEDIRPAAFRCLTELRSERIGVAILTGDHAKRAARLTRELGVRVKAELKPEQKSIEIRRLRSEGDVVAMVGDGINDAPALSAADVGIALGCGTDVTRHSADLCLLGDDLNAIPLAIQIARETVSTIRGNLAWSFGYNSIGVALAMFGLLHPSIAAILMVVSSGVVIFRSVRLSRDSQSTDALVGDAVLAGPTEDLSRTQPGSGAQVINLEEVVR